MHYMERYRQWLADDAIDEGTKEELRRIEHDTKEIEDRFYRVLEFGTGGLRGVIGAGSNRMNIYTIGVATQGLANYIKKLGPEMSARGVAIAYDSRHFSLEFAEEAARVLNGNCIKVHLFDGIRTTPQLSFAVRYLSCAAGIVITASHNPSQYNGYKVYSSAGMQLGLEESDRVIDEVKSIHDFSQIRRMDREEAVKEGLFTYISRDVDHAYMDAVLSQCIHGDVIREVAEDFRVVYTPLHGTGKEPVMRALEEVGFTQVSIVKEQADPDGDFPTVQYPNPEDQEAFRLALELAKEGDAHLVIATDPDCDRVGVTFKDKAGEYVFLNGNQTGALLTYYILSSLKERGKLPENGALIKTIVTSELGARIAHSFGVSTFDTLTGFKFIGEVMERFYREGTYKFILGFEESYGYLIGDHARDKDGVVASLMVAEMAAYYHHRGMTLDQVLDRIYREYGYYFEDLISLTLEGKEGLERIQEIMTYFRETCPMTWQGRRVARVEDYLIGKSYDGLGNVLGDIHLPKSNVLKFILEDDSWFCIRPSGTEPKIKFYFSVIGGSMEEARAKSQALSQEVVSKISE